MTVGITYGTFDLLHYGHIALLKRAKELCDFLIVGLSTDEFNRLKGKQSYFNFNERKSMLGSLKHVDFIIPETSWEQKEQDIERYKVDIFIIGDDWKGKFDNLECKVTYLPRTKLISSTKIKEALNV